MSITVILATVTLRMGAARYLSRLLVHDLSQFG
jgi:hypothetical protein